MPRTRLVSPSSTRASVPPWQWNRSSCRLASYFTPTLATVGPGRPKPRRVRDGRCSCVRQRVPLLFGKCRGPVDTHEDIPSRLTPSKSTRPTRLVEPVRPVDGRPISSSDLSLTDRMVEERSYRHYSRGTRIRWRDGGRWY